MDLDAKFLIYTGAGVLVLWMLSKKEKTAAAAKKQKKNAITSEAIRSVRH